MIEVHRWKILGDGKKVSLYKNEKQMRKGMEICLKSIRTIRELLYELEFEEYVENDGILSNKRTCGPEQYCPSDASSIRF